MKKKGSKVKKRRALNQGHLFFDQNNQKGHLCSIAVSLRNSMSWCVVVHWSISLILVPLLLEADKQDLEGRRLLRPRREASAEASNSSPATLFVLERLQHKLLSGAGCGTAEKRRRSWVLHLGLGMFPSAPLLFSKLGGGSVGSMIFMAGPEASSAEHPLALGFQEGRCTEAIVNPEILSREDFLTSKFASCLQKSHGNLGGIFGAVP